MDTNKSFYHAHRRLRWVMRALKDLEAESALHKDDKSMVRQMLLSLEPLYFRLCVRFGFLCFSQNVATFFENGRQELKKIASSKDLPSTLPAQTQGEK